jgi:hypothetical protein
VAYWSKWLVAARVLKFVEVDVPDVAFTGPVLPDVRSLGAARCSSGLAADRARMRVEVDVPHVVVTRPTRSLC